VHFTLSPRATAVEEGASSPAPALTRTRRALPQSGEFSLTDCAGEESCSLLSRAASKLSVEAVCPGVVVVARCERGGALGGAGGVTEGESVSGAFRSASVAGEIPFAGHDDDVEANCHGPQTITTTRRRRWRCIEKAF